MSIPFLIGNFTSEADKRRKEAYYTDLLNQQIKNNETVLQGQDYAEAILQNEERLSIPFKVPKSQMTQKQKQAVSLLEGVMPSELASDIIARYFLTEPSLDLLLSNFSDFNSQMPPDFKYTGLLFKTLWDRYMENLRIKLMKGSTSISSSSLSPVARPFTPRVVPPGAVNPDNLIKRLTQLYQDGRITDTAYQREQQGILNAAQTQDRIRLQGYNYALSRLENRQFS